MSSSAKSGNVSQGQFVLPDGSISLARLLDHLRDQLAAAAEQDEAVQTILVHPLVFQAIAKSKAYERYTSQPPRLFGLEVRPSETIPRNAVAFALASDVR